MRLSAKIADMRRNYEGFGRQTRLERWEADAADLERRIETMMAENKLLMEERNELLVKLAAKSAEQAKPDPWAAFPPPEGEEWHNPDGLTPEQVGVNDGWRLALGSEVCLHEASPLCGKCGLWSKTRQLWESGHWNCDGKELTYRTRAPLPTKPETKREAFELPNDEGAFACEGLPYIVAANFTALRDRIREIEARLERGGL